ncbi:hypothetical protein ACXR2U_05305 [Jatrophihabitans sp. YIM 134969]
MTRSEHDLRTLLRAPVDPSVVDRVLDRAGAGDRRPAGRRRPLVVAAVAALALVLVVGVVLAVVNDRPGGRSAPQPPVAPTSSATTSPTPTAAALPAGAFVAAVDPGTPYSLSGEDSSTTAEELAVFSKDSAVPIPVARLVVSTPGTRHDPLIAGRAPVTLTGGTPARWVMVRYLSNTPHSTTPPEALDAVQWTDPSGLVFTVAATNPNVKLLLAIAAATHLADATPSFVPMRVTSLPSGWTFAGVTTESVYCCVAMTEGQIDVTATFDTPAGSGGTPGAAVECVGAAWANRFTYRGTPVQIDGRTWLLDTAAGTLTWRGPDRSIRIGNSLAAGESGYPAVTSADLEAIAGSLVLSSSIDSGMSWFDATTAFAP